MSYIRYNNKLVQFNNKYVVQSPAPPDERFITEWNMTSTSFTLLTTAFTGGVFDYYVDWGDNSAETHVTSSTSPTHTYPSTGTYQIKIRGSFPRIYINNNATHKTKLTKILNWGNVNFRTFQSAFRGCDNLIELPNGPITGATLVSTEGFYQTFYYCTSLTSIPVDLFRYNTLVSTNGFNGTFRLCTSLTTIPAEIFKYNTLVSNNGFVSTFLGCTALTTIPEDLFRYNVNVSDYAFYSTFSDCTKLKLNPWIFYADGEQSTRFLNKNVNFSYCFDRSSYTNAEQGTAPDLWNCDFGTGTATKTDCFNGAGNSLTSLSNYNDIPIEWL